MFKRSNKGWAKHLDFILLDLLCIVIAYFLAYGIRYGFNNLFQRPVYVTIFVLIILLDFLILLILDTLKNVLKRGYYREGVKTINQSVIIYLVISVYLFITKTAVIYSRFMISVLILIYTVLTYTVRLLWKKHLYHKMNMRKGNTLLIISSEDIIPRLVEKIQENDYNGHKVVGAVVSDPKQVGKMIDQVEVVADYDTAIDYIKSNWVDEVLISLYPGNALPDDFIDTLVSMGVTVHISIDDSVFHTGTKQVIGNLAGSMVISTSMNYMTPVQAVEKRIMDIVGGMAGCIITGILILIIGPKIKKESPGPLFFTQTRVGRNGKTFKMYKFRSMYLDAEERKKELMAQNRIKDGLMFKMEFDPRVIGNHIDENGNQVTGIGEMIRKYSLDEFPQFFNVLKGDMSLVGTRPPLMDEYAAYSAHHKGRLAIKPGITGMWQVSGRSEILDFEEVVKLDTEYINNWSIGLDLKILFRTFTVVLKKEGAM